MKLWISLRQIHLVAVHQNTRSRFTHFAVVCHTTTSRIIKWWVFCQEMMCKLTHIGGSTKDTSKAYIPVNYLAEHNEALWSVCSVWIGKEAERTDSPTETGIRIQRQRDPQPDLDTDNDTPGVADGESEFLRCKNILSFYKINYDGIKRSKIKHQTWTIFQLMLWAVCKKRD